MPPKIYVNGRFLDQKTTGVQRYAMELLRALDRLPLLHERYTITVLTTQQQLPSRPIFQNIRLRSVGKLRGQVWEQFELPFHARDGVLLSLCNLGPLFARRQIVTIHDASVAALPSNYGRRFRWWYNFALPILCRRALRVITDSQFSKSELVRFYRAKADTVKVVPLGVEHLLAQRADSGVLAKHGLTRGMYILAVSSLSPHKNLAGIVDAVEKLEERKLLLVLAGASNAAVFAHSAISSSKRVKHIGYVSDGELRALYEGALCFVYPSLYEGFGLPPMEAMSCACPVVVSNIPALVEACGTAALYCEPRDPRDICDKISALANTPQLRRKLSDEGRQRIRDFTWDQCAAGVVSIIDEGLSA